jgi:hypothetical protein
MFCQHDPKISGTLYGCSSSHAEGVCYSKYCGFRSGVSLYRRLSKATRFSLGVRCHGNDPVAFYPPSPRADGLLWSCLHRGNEFTAETSALVPAWPPACALPHVRVLLGVRLRTVRFRTFGFC